MRAAAVIVLGVVGLAACGGSPPPPPEAPSADTSSLETGSGSKGKDKEPSDDTPAPASSSTASSAAAPAASSAPPAAEKAPAAAFHPAPSATGTIDGKPFSPKVAQVVGPMKKDGTIALILTEATECPAPGDAKADPSGIRLVIPWSDGYKVDLAALKLSGKKGQGDIGFSRSKKDVSTTFKPSGNATVVSAPMAKGATGKLKIDLQSGDYMLAGTVDVEVCVSPK